MYTRKAACLSRCKFCVRNLLCVCFHDNRAVHACWTDSSLTSSKNTKKPVRVEVEDPIDIDRKRDGKRKERFMRIKLTSIGHLCNVTNSMHIPLFHSPVTNKFISLV